MFHLSRVYLYIDWYDLIILLILNEVAFFKFFLPIQILSISILQECINLEITIDRKSYVYIDLQAKTVKKLRRFLKTLIWILNLFLTRIQIWPYILYITILLLLLLLLLLQHWRIQNCVLIQCLWDISVTT